jgi:hypothetical protein
MKQASGRNWYKVRRKDVRQASLAQIHFLPSSSKIHYFPPPPSMSPHTTAELWWKWEIMGNLQGKSMLVVVGMLSPIFCYLTVGGCVCCSVLLPWPTAYSSGWSFVAG